MADDYELGTVGPIPTVNPNVAKIGELLNAAKTYANQYYVKDYVPLIGGTQLGDMLLGQAPEEIQRWGQGDYPVRNPSEVTGTGGNRLDIWKIGRFEPTFDVATNVVAPTIGAAKLTKGLPVGLSMMGPESKLWNKEMAFNAGKMEAKGATPEEIHKATGMARGLDNQWRQEIIDKFATMKNGENFGEIYRKAGLDGIWSKDKVLVKDVLHHPELLEAYPELGNLTVKTHSADNPVKGAFNQNKGFISIREDLSPSEATSTMLHELTHGIQSIEEWNRGANAGTLIKHYAKEKEGIMSQIENINRQGSEAYKADDMDKYRSLMAQRDILSRKYINFNPEEIGYDMYKHHAGEAEARMVQSRYGLTQEQSRQFYPYANAEHGLDINPDEAIVTTKHPATINTPSQSVDYRGAHKAPYKTDDGTTAPGHELDKTFPSDVYGPKGHIYYGDGDKKMDKDTLDIMKAAKGKPDHPITVYRAVPTEYTGEDIHPGDWVTPNLDYAEKHGQYFDNGYQILEKTVPAKHIYTEANSLHEFGYDPTD